MANPEIEKLFIEATSLYNGGHYIGAEKEYRRASEGYSLLSNKNDLKLEALLIAGIANCLREQAIYEGLEDKYHEAISIIEGAGTNKDTQSVLGSLESNFSSYFCDQNRYIEAEILHQKAIDHYGGTVGIGSPEYVLVSINDADISYGNKDYENAAHKYESILRITKERYGEHPLCAKVFYKFANCLRDKKVFEAAKDNYSLSLKIYNKSILGSFPIKNKVYNDLVECQKKEIEYIWFMAKEAFEKGRRAIWRHNKFPYFIEAASLRQQIIDLHKDMGKEENPDGDYIWSFWELAVCIQRQEIYEKAIEQFNLAIEKYENIWVEKLWEKDRRNYEKCKEYKKDCVDAIEKRERDKKNEVEVKKDRLNIFKQKFKELRNEKKWSFIWKKKPEWYEQWSCCEKWYWWLWSGWECSGGLWDRWRAIILLLIIVVCTFWKVIPCTFGDVVSIDKPDKILTGSMLMGNTKVEAGYVIASKEDIMDYLKKVLPFFTIDIILIFLARHFFARARAFFEIAEVYEAHILLIDSDDYYLKDEQLIKLAGIEKEGERNEKLAEKLFDLRLANIQRINELPDRVLSIMGHTADSDMPYDKVLELISKAKDISK